MRIDVTRHMPKLKNLAFNTAAQCWHWQIGEKHVTL